MDAVVLSKINQLSGKTGRIFDDSGKIYAAHMERTFSSIGKAMNVATTTSVGMGNGAVDDGQYLYS